MTRENSTPLAATIEHSYTTAGEDKGELPANTGYGRSYVLYLEIFWNLKVTFLGNSPSI